MSNIMGDLETLDTVATAVIMSIGAVKFDLSGKGTADHGFYASISIESNLEMGRTISEDTLKFWMSQSPEARKVFNEPKVSLHDALERFDEWCRTDKDLVIWSNGASFDIPMLEHAFRSFGMEAPWKFWNHRCFRTYKNLPGAKAITMPVHEGVAHNALADAYNQVLDLQALHAGLFGKKK